MEWLGILLLYAISGWMKKKQRDAKNKEIESDPSWDAPEEQPKKKQQTNLDQLLSDLFEQVDKSVQINPKDPLDLETPLEEESDGFIESQTLSEPIPEPILYSGPDEDLTSIDEQTEAFEEKIYHSKLADRKEQHYGKKWKKKSQLRSELFDSKKSLKKAIILKEVLDKPLSLR